MSSDISIETISGPSSKALFACSSCRAQKKGCDKVFPTCSACVRLRRVCRYSSGPAPPSIPADYQKLVERVAHLENEIAHHRKISNSDSVSILPHSTSRVTSAVGDRYSPPDVSTFPSAFFLDVGIFQWQRIKAPKPQITIPDDVLQAIGDDMEIRTILGTHFVSVFTWMAIVSKKRLHQDIGGQLMDLEADVALLILSMKLSNEKLPADQKTPRTHLYTMTKEFYSRVESSGIGSIRLLQAGILTALYEIGNVIYPEAYLSIGRCGRLGQAIGLHDTAGIPQLALEPESWDEMEERRRVWWTIFILDRKVCCASSMEWC